MKSQLTLLCLMFCSIFTFSQKQIYKSDFTYFNFENENLYSTLGLSGNTIVFNASDYAIYGIDKTTYKTKWEHHAGTKTDQAIFFYKDTFFFNTHKDQESKAAQFGVETGRIIKELQVESIATKPYFMGDTFYFTGSEKGGGGALFAYDLDQNQIVWQKFIGHGSDFQPVYQKNKIVASVDKNYWTHLNYSGKNLPMHSQKSFEIGDTPYFVLNYAFLTHDGKEISEEFLRINDLTNKYDFATTENHTLIIGNHNLMVLGNNKKLKVLLDLLTLRTEGRFDKNAASKIIQTDSETVWFIDQNHLIHYDYKKKKLLRNISLDDWRPHQLIVDHHTIWLISKNDGELYALDFEPNEAIARKLDREKAIQDHLRCTFPDPKKIAAAKEAEEKYKNQ